MTLSSSPGQREPMIDCVFSFNYQIMMFCPLQNYYAEPEWWDWELKLASKEKIPVTSILHPSNEQTKNSAKLLNRQKSYIPQNPVLFL